MHSPDDRVDALLAEVRACRACADLLPLGPRPVLQMSPTARILVASQAPARRCTRAACRFPTRRAIACANGWGFQDSVLRRGEYRHSSDGALLSWTIEERRCAAAPGMRAALAGSAARGHAGAAADAFGRQLCPEPCARPRRADRTGPQFRGYLPTYFPLPHPSWRAMIWGRKHPWFEKRGSAGAARRIRRALARASGWR